MASPNAVEFFTGLCHGRADDQRLKNKKNTGFHVTSFRACLAALCLTLPAAASVAATPIYAESWRLYNLTGAAGMSGVFPVDLDGNGDREFVVGLGNTGWWGIADYDAGSHEYNLLWRYKSDVSPPLVLRAMQLIETGNTKYLWQGFEDGHVDIWDLLARTKIGTVQVDSAAVTDFAFADGNNDGTFDVVVLTENRIAMLDPLTFAIRIANIPQAPAGFLSVGNVAGDARNEIVVSNGNVIRVDGATPVVTAVYSRGAIFGGEVELGDIDGDSYLELIAHDFEGGADVVRAWDLSGTPAIKWTKQVAGQLSHLHLQDLFGDVTPEAIYTDGLAAHVLDLNTRAELWNLNSFCCGVGDFAVFDSDADGDRDFLVGAGFLGPAGNFYAVDFDTKNIDFISSSMTAFFSAIDVADVDNDGTADIVAISGGSEGGGGESIVSIYNAVTHALEWRSDGRFFDPYGSGGHIQAARIANIDADPQAEIIVAGSDINGDRVFVIDGISHALEDQWHFDMGSVLTNVDVADVDGDGDQEIAVSNVDGGTNFPGHRIYVIDPATGTRWSTQIAGLSASSRVQFTDVGAAGNDLLAVNGKVTKVRWSDKQQVASALSLYSSAAAMDITGTIAREIVAGRSDGLIDMLDGDSLALRDTFAPCPGADIRAIVDHGGKVAAMMCGEILLLYDFAARTVVTQTNTSLYLAGVNGSLRKTKLAGRDVLLIGGEAAAVFTDINSNHAPVIPAGGFLVHWRGSADYTVGATDADNDPLTYAFAGLPALGVASWQDGPPGVLHYVANGTAKGADSIGVSVFDGAASAARNIAVTLTNTAPAATTAALTMHWRGAHSTRLEVSDPNGDPVTARIVTAPSHGAIAFTNASTGDITFTPSGAFVGDDTFSYDAYDGADASTARSVQLTLTNAAPAATTTALTLHWRGAQDAQLAASDPDGDPLTIRLGTAPAHGSLNLTNAANGTAVFTPAGAFVGSDSFTYDAFDGASVSAVRTVQLTLTNAVPGAPAPVTRDIVIGTNATGTLAATDADHDPLTYLVTAQPARGTLTLDAASGQFTYVPIAGTGDVTATVTASDGASQSAAATVTFHYPEVVVVQPPPPPSGGSGGGKKGGGSIDAITLCGGFALLALANYLRRRAAPYPADVLSETIVDPPYQAARRPCV